MDRGSRLAPSPKRSWNGLPFRPTLPLVVSLAFTGCVPYRALDMPERAAHSLPVRQEHDGLVLAAWTLLHENDVARYFGPDLWAEGYFPVIVHLENHGTQPAVLERKRFTLRLQRRGEGEGDTQEPVAPVEAIEACERSTWPAWGLAPLLVVPAIWAYRSIADYNFELTQDWTGKALPAYFRVEPADHAIMGALFFRRPGATELLGDALENAELRAAVKLEGTRLDETENGSAAADESRVGRTMTFILALRGGAQ